MTMKVSFDFPIPSCRRKEFSDKREDRVRLTRGPALPLLPSTYFLEGAAGMHDTVPTSHSVIGSAGPRGHFDLSLGSA